MTPPSEPALGERALCELCGEPMPPGEQMFKFHGYSGDCPKPPLERPISDDQKLVADLSAIWLRLNPSISDPVAVTKASALIAEAATRITQLLAQVKELSDDFAVGENELATLKAENESLRAQNARSSAAWSAMNERQAAEWRRAESAEQQLSDARKEIERLTKDGPMIDGELFDIAGNSEPCSMRKALEYTKAALQLEAKHSDEINAQLAAARAEIERLQQELGECSGGLETADKEIAAARAEAEGNRRDAERHNHARRCARLGQHGEWVIIPEDTHNVYTMHRDYDAAIDSALGGPKT